MSFNAHDQSASVARLFFYLIFLFLLFIILIRLFTTVPSLGIRKGELSNMTLSFKREPK